MTEPIWLEVGKVIDMHAEQLAIFEDRKAFGSRPSRVGHFAARHQWHYGQTDMAALAAA